MSNLAAEVDKRRFMGLLIPAGALPLVGIKLWVNFGLECSLKYNVLQ